LLDKASAALLVWVCTVLLALAMSRLLDNIDAPADVKALKQVELKALAAEIREELISRVDVNGGHLASNLACTGYLTAQKTR
jgi:hypothetical protein